MDENSDQSNEMLFMLREILIQMRKTIEKRTERLLEMEEILVKRKTQISEIDKSKQKDMNDEEKELYNKDQKKQRLTGSYKLEKDKERDGEAIDIYEYNKHITQMEYLQELDRNFGIFLGIDIYYLKVTMLYFKAIKQSRRMQKRELVISVFGDIIITHLKTLSMFYTLKAPYKEPEYFFNYLKDPNFLLNLIRLLSYLSTSDLKQIFSSIRESFFTEIVCNYRFFLKLIDPKKKFLEFKPAGTE
jgi:hypothetical protein